MVILSYFVAIATVFFGYRVWKNRVTGKKFSEMKGLVYGLVICIVILWVINIFIGFLQ